MSTLSDRSVQGNTCEDGRSLGKYLWTSGQGTLLLGTYSLHTLVSHYIDDFLGGFEFHFVSRAGDRCNYSWKPHFFPQIFFSKISSGSDTSRGSYLEIPAVTSDPGTFLIQC